MAQIANKAAKPAQPQPRAPSPAPQPRPEAAAAPRPAPQPERSEAPKAQATPPAAASRSRIESLKEEYQTLLHRLHERVFDAPREQLFFVPTKEPAALSGLTIASPNRAFGHDYRPIPCKVFDWALDQIPEDFSEFTFVDYGAGKGRAMLLAAEHPFAAVAGVEFAAELHDNAQMNIAQYPRSNMRCRNVECVLEDAVQVGPPEGASVHFFFNPVRTRGVRGGSEQSRDGLSDEAAAALSHPSRRRRGGPGRRKRRLARVEPSQVDELKLKLLSPHAVTVYRSLA
ncbi:hypothetical protein [Methyloceanibacter methanicus]|nr:hypothetical protein [Methyloceanibacter methanicus]